MRELQEVSSSHMDNDSYMYGKLLGFLRVSSLDPEFLIQCPDQETCTRANSRAAREFSSGWRKSSSEALKPVCRKFRVRLQSFSAQIVSGWYSVLNSL